MKKLLYIVLLLCAAGFANSARAQYYTWGSDPTGLRWSYIKTPDVRIIYPDTVAAAAQRTLFYIRAVQPDIGFGFRHGPMRIPFVLHPMNFQSNGLVMFLPKRVEFLTSPAIEGYSMPWYKQLVAHEYRHAVQYSNLDRGIVRVLSYLLGQQGSTIGLLCMPIWAMEGDAVMSETAMSSFGRGMQPSFSMGFRAMKGFSNTKRNVDKWFCGSYRDYVPDHYELGYQICAYTYDRFGENVWDKVAWFGSRNIYMLATTRIALEKYYDTNVTKLFHETFDSLDNYWDSLPAVEDSAATLTPLEEGNYTTYRWSLALPAEQAGSALPEGGRGGNAKVSGGDGDGGGQVLALKSDFDRPARFVSIDPETGRERVVAHVGQLSTRPVLGNGRIWWTEYRRSLLFEQKVNSQLCYMNLADGIPRKVAGVRNALYPTSAGDDLAWVDYNPSGRYTVIVRRAAGAQERWPVPEWTEIHGLAWDDVTKSFYVLLTDDEGMWIGRIDQDGVRAITQPAYVTLSDLRADGGRLYFGSIESGRDEAHCYDLAQGRQYRLTESAYGSFAPAPASSATPAVAYDRQRGGPDEVLVTTYDRLGYRVAVQQADSASLKPVEWSKLPRNVVNPPHRKWDVVNLDTVRFTTADSLEQSKKFRRKRYSKGLTLINNHSWMPIAFNPFAAVDEHDIDVNLGVTLISQNLLSNAEAYVSYGWNANEGSLVNLGLRYFGLGVHLDLDYSYGGDQLFYSLVAYDPDTGNPIYQARPDPERYHSIELGATLPLYFQRGYHTRSLSLWAAWNYSNGMVANMGNIEWENDHITNIERIGFRKGLHKISMGAGFSDQVRLAYRDFAPRWGYTVSASYTLNPANAHFSNLISFYGQAYLPGVAPHHSVRLAATYQTSLGGYKFPTGYAPLSYKSTRLIPRGFTSADIMSNNYTAVSADYQLPVWYPDGGINSVVYIKRIRLNLGGDYAQFRQPQRGGMTQRRIWSAGADLVFDLNLFSQPASATSVFKLSLYRPSSGGVWWAASVGLPF